MTDLPYAMRRRQAHDASLYAMLLLSAMPRHLPPAAPHASRRIKALL